MLSTLISFLLKTLPLPPQTTNTPPCCVDVSLQLHNGSHEKSKFGEDGGHEDNMCPVPFNLLYKAEQQAQWNGQESRAEWTK